MITKCNSRVRNKYLIKINNKKILERTINNGPNDFPESSRINNAPAADDSGARYPQKRFSATALSRQISVPKKPDTINGPCVTGEIPG